MLSWRQGVSEDSQLCNYRLTELKFVDLWGMVSVSVSYVVGWEDNRKRFVWLFCFSSEANRRASVLAMLYYQCSDAGGIYAFLTLKNTEGEKNPNAQLVNFPRRLSH